MADGTITRNEIISLVVRLTLVSAAAFFGMKWMIERLDPTNKKKTKARQKAQEQLKRLAASGDAPLVIDNLSEYEMMIAAHLVHPHDMTVSWSSIAGLESLIQELRETVILPIKRKELFADSQLAAAPKGVLLCGPPGCGKTMIAKATAKEAGMCFINLDLSILTDKWYGESQKLASAVFSLAVKLQPCIIFIDEIDSFLRTRTSNDHEATAMMKAQFMSLWDGLTTAPDSTVIVLGTTNRLRDVDQAVLRRLPATFHVSMPNIVQRKKILDLTLDKEPIADDIDIEAIAKCTEGFSGSDLRELCRNASIYRVRDFMKDHSSEEEFHDALRPIAMDDLMISYQKMREVKMLREGLPMVSRIDLD